MARSGFDLSSSAYQEMIHEGFNPDWTPEINEQVAALKTRRASLPDKDVRNLRDLLWSSIDNDTSRDLDQVEVADHVDGNIRILIGAADVASDVPIGSPIDRHANFQTTTVYTAVRTFSMIPEELSTDLTSLTQDSDRLAVVIEMLVDSNGSITSSNIYRALVRNKAQLTYPTVGPWLEGSGPPPPKISACADLKHQLKLQDEAACALRDRRYRLGALNFDRVEAEPVIEHGDIKGIQSRRKNRASDLIEDFMIAANQTMPQTLTRSGISVIRRVVK